ncbi:MAG: Fe(3+) ABC transporter substrate-binding protein [Synechococcales cyanobacterium K44_A2020_017]|nr:Fe(3+) ABC transporter substrate-binding protein [Synechococcales cyanobacterium K32_A2020_035]MBF2093618.1 Fe(3+) ABC transporter substrate-binding protein [Synechococcales cyanobacterium K44_A2020_017]
MKLKRRTLFAGLTGAAMAIAIGCASQSTDTATDTTTDAASDTASAPASDGEVVNLYSSRHYDTDNSLYEGFTEETGIEVNLIEGDADELLERIKSEGANSPADVYMTVDAGRLWLAEQEGLLQPVESDVLTAAIPENLRHPDGLWFGLTTRARVIVYNKDTVDPSELSTYEDLADPKWQGRVCIRSSGNIYNLSLVGSMVETMGEEATQDWVEGLVSNLAREPEGGDTDQIKAVASGQCDVAIANHYYWARLAKSEDAAEQAVAEQVGIFFPNQDDRGTHVNISGAGVLAAAPNPENAIAFIEYLVSPEAQEIFAAGNNEYPVLEGVNVDPIVSELGNFKVDAVNVASYGRNNPKVVEIVDRAGWK